MEDFDEIYVDGRPTRANSDGII